MPFSGAPRRTHRMRARQPSVTKAAAHSIQPEARQQVDGRGAVLSHLLFYGGAVRTAARSVHCHSVSESKDSFFFSIPSQAVGTLVSVVTNDLWQGSRHSECVSAHSLVKWIERAPVKQFRSCVFAGTLKRRSTLTRQMHSINISSYFARGSE